MKVAQKTPCLTAVVLLLTVGLSHSQNEIPLACPDDWTLYGSRCYRVFTERLAWQDAAHTCRNNGAHLVRIFGYEENEAISQMAAQAGSTAYWIGLNRRELENSLDARDTSAHWHGVPPHMRNATIYQGYWRSDQPAVMMGECVNVQVDESEFYPVGWGLGDCVHPNNFICEAPAGLQGFFRCANGRYVLNTVCDGEDDCGDNSDEADCRAQCNVMLAGTGGTGISSGAPYASNSNCMWTIEGPVGQRVSLTFTSFNTEDIHDRVTILIGGKTESTSMVLKRLSGNLNIGDLPRYYSSNNLMIVKFTSDSSVQRAGFEFDWTTDDQFPGVNDERMATETPTEIQSPMYGSMVLANQRHKWIISAPGDHHVVSLKVLELDLPECAYVKVYSQHPGYTFSLLATLRAGSDVQSVISTTSVMQLYLHTCERHSTRHAGFRVTYQTGCMGEINADSGYVISPGFLAEENYPNFQTCTWRVTSASGERLHLVFRDPFGLQDGVDFLKIYEGTDATGREMGTYTGTVLPSSVGLMSTSGQLYVEFTTSSIINARGFRFDFATPCPTPNFNVENVVSPASFDVTLDSQIEVSCSAGFQFAQEEHAGETLVRMECRPGGWSVRQTPQCEPVWCGQAPLLENGFYLSSTGSRKDDTVTYGCYDGFTLSGDDTITCDGSGMWGQPPTCTASSCPALPTFTDPNGSRENTVGTGTGFGDIVEYTCEPGYQLDGAARIICTETGWSDAEPSCVILTCPADFFVSQIEHATFAYTEPVEVGDTITVTCDSGFALIDAALETVTCQNDQSFAPGLPSCEDVPECNASPCSGGECVETEGSFRCECPPGYELINPTTCQDIAECSGPNDCSQQCNEEDGGYTCSCNIPGYSLYTEDGTEGYFLPEGETGLRSDDTYHINHTCVRVQCPAVPAMAYGSMLSTQTDFHLSDSLTYLCDLGFVVNGVNGQNDITINCGADGNWDIDPNSFNCTPATCAEPDVSGLQYAPVFTARGPYSYLQNVFIRCSVLRPSFILFARRCSYDYTDGFYKLYKQNESMECPVVDCKDPALSLPPGAEVFIAPSSTLYQSTFTVRCANLFTQDGNTPSNDGVVECAGNGKWDFGTFQCNGAGCTDPGTNAGTVQTPDGFYSPGEFVSYECTQGGFALNNSYPLVCGVVGAIPTWNASAPICLDVTPPIIDQAENLCGTTITIAPLEAPMFSLPTVSDNTGATENSGLDLSLSADNDDPSIALLSSKVFSYTATDFEGLTDTCDITVQVEAQQMPTITCPEPVVITIGDNDVTANTNDYSLPTSSLTVVVSPTTFQSGPARIGEYEIITGTVTDENGLTASCQYMVVFEVPTCSPYALAAPESGTLDCSSTATGYSCVVSCNTGTFFYDLSNDDTVRDTVTYTCTTGGTFQVDKVPQCVPFSLASYFFRFNVIYDNAQRGASSATCLEHYQDTITALLVNEVADNLAELCQSSIGNTQTSTQTISVDTSTLGNDFDLVYDTDMVLVNMTFQLGPETISRQTAEGICLLFFTAHFSGWNTAAAPLQNIAGTAECPPLSSSTSTSTVVDLTPETSLQGEYRCTAEGRKAVTSENINYCLPCPQGTRYDSVTDLCVECPVGQYQDQASRSTCRDCPADSLTYDTGATSADQCVETCNVGVLAGFTSSTGLAPCTQCPDNTYASSATTCTPCPADTATAQPGASSIAQCLGECTPGLYSLTGYENCTECPQHFYQNLEGQSTCVECDASRYTTGTGSTAPGDCLVGADFCANSNPCQNGGTCEFDNHHAYCTGCDQGYTGRFCEILIDACASDPCYYNMLCSSTSAGFSCDCPAGYSGDRCETDPDNCVSNACENGGQCQDLENTYVCLCPPGFTGTTCTETEDICTAQPCANGAVCRAITAQRRVCDCPAGYEGDDCSTNLDNCASYPCHFGAECTDDGTSFRCDCPAGLSDRDCSIRGDLCTAGPCAETAECVDDYTTNNLVCVCNQGYDSQPVSRRDTWLEGNINISVNESCSLRDYCVPDPCQNGAMCSSSTAGAECACPAGFEGSRCQYNIDDCASNPCGVGGECMDMVDGYNCSCNAGFEGDDCETNINECEVPAYPCVSEGTDEGQGQTGCQDLIGGFRCYCLPGYSGDDCGDNVNECLSNPCLHGGRCEDGVDSYTCDCAAGWTGARCETVQEYCDPDPCQNSAECLTVFGNYTCVCDFPFFGSQCESEADTCMNASPCIDPESRCFTDDQGQAECLCSPAYAGQGCHVSVDFCSHDNFCNYNGQCTASLDNYSCECGADFSGDRCQNSEDNCATVVCAGGGTCIDGIGEYMCMCPVGKQGPACDKDTDSDWDLHFYDSMRSGAAYQPYPFPLGSNVTELSVGMWVRYTEAQGEGTFFTLYGLETDKLTGPRRILMQCDAEQIRLSLTPVARQEIDFGVYDINDREWYYVTMTWDKMSGELSVYVNAVLLRRVQLYARGDDLPPYGVILLGSEWSEDALHAVRMSGFNGLVSHVYLWQQVLMASPDVTSMADDRDNLVRSDALIVDWGTYVTEGGVEVQRPSTAGDDVCPPGFTGSQCSARLPDKEPPTIVSCPHNVHVTSQDRITQVEWEEPVFENSVGEVEAVYPNRRVFIWGRYPNWYVAQDANGNAAVCSFDIFVRMMDCPQPDSPLNGVQVCSDPNAEGDHWPYRYCQASCDANFEFTTPTPNFFTCGPQGTFNVDSIFLGFEFPACGPNAQGSGSVTVTLVYRDVPACSEIQRVDAFGIRIYARLDELNGQWLERGSGVGGLCGASDCADSVMVETSCGGGGARRRRQTEDAVVTITIPSVQDPLMDASDNTIERTAAEILTQDVLDGNGFDFSDQITNGSPDPAALVIDGGAVCQPGSVLSNGACVECAPGSSYDNATQTCVFCAIGEYQDMAGQYNCIMCPNGFTTELEGSTSQSDCAQASCPAGTRYNEGTSSCEDCPVGFYQPDPDQYFCYPCAADKTTTGPRSTSETACFEVCPSGTQLVLSGQCEACPLGTYRTQGVQASCVDCPTGYTTPTENSLRQEDCTVRECFAGTFINATGDCEDCPVGTFQSQDYQTSCVPCGNQRTTLAPRSDSNADCLFYCFAGEEDPDSDGVCTLCDVGYYKDNERPGAVCDQCRAGFVTPSTGANDASFCTVLACLEGEQPNAARDGCEACPRGTFQDTRYQDACVACTDLFPGQDVSTRTEGSTSSAQCEEYCPSGSEKVGGVCELCGIGYYKDNSGGNEYEPCALCPVEFITATEGAASESNCVVRNCTEGYYRSESLNTCVECPIGEYQDQKWQLNCTACPPQTTTDNLASTSADDCRLSCEPGFEDRAGAPEECVECARGTYKSARGVQQCDTCPDGFTTPSIGATQASQCSIADCQPGTYLDPADDQRCLQCPYGTYTNAPWQTQCETCPNGRTTLEQGTSSAALCVPNCPSGQEYDVNSRQCEACPRGYYRTQNVHPVCVMCDEEFVTEGTGATTVLDCNFRNCSAGTRFDRASDACEPCATGTYQDRKWQTSCVACGQGFTTFTPGSDSRNDCVLNCTAGSVYDPVTRACEDCARGTYKSNAESQCTPCPDGFTTLTTSATSQDDCDAENCQPGYRINDATLLCEPCPVGYYQDEEGQLVCKPCGPNLDVISTTSTGAVSPQDCISTDECAVTSLNDCVASNLGGICTDNPGVDYVCSCEQGYSGDGRSTSHGGTGCTHICDQAEPYCERGDCIGDGPDAYCDCPSDYEGDRCQRLKADDDDDDDRNVLIGATVGAGVGLLALILIITAVCCCCFRQGPSEYKEAPQPQFAMMPSMAPSMVAYDNTMMSGVITRPATRFAGSTLGGSTMFNDGASIAGFPGNQQKYLIYDEADDTPIIQNNGMSNSGYDSAYEERGSSLQFT